MDMIPDGAIVGTADSVTRLQVGVISELQKRGRDESPPFMLAAIPSTVK